MKRITADSQASRGSEILLADLAKEIFTLPSVVGRFAFQGKNIPFDSRQIRLFRFSFSRIIKEEGPQLFSSARKENIVKTCFFTDRSISFQLDRQIINNKGFLLVAEFLLYLSVREYRYSTKLCRKRVR